MSRLSSILISMLKKFDFWINSRYPAWKNLPIWKYRITRDKMPTFNKECDTFRIRKSTEQNQIGAFCLTVSENNYKLKPSHQYYYQVQLQMGILEISKKCDPLLPALTISTLCGLMFER